MKKLTLLMLLISTLYTAPTKTIEKYFRLTMVIAVGSAAALFGTFQVTRGSLKVIGGLTLAGVGVLTLWQHKRIVRAMDEKKAWPFIKNTGNAIYHFFYDRVSQK